MMKKRILTCVTLVFALIIFIGCSTSTSEINNRTTITTAEVLDTTTDSGTTEPATTTENITTDTSDEDFVREYNLFSYGLVSIEGPDGIYRYYNNNFEVVIDKGFIFARNFEGGVALVRTSEGDGVIDLNGNYILEPTKSEICIYPEIERIISTSLETSIYDLQGNLIKNFGENIIVSPLFENADLDVLINNRVTFENYRFVLSDNNENLKYLIDIDGNKLSETGYNSLQSYNYIGMGEYIIYAYVDQNYNPIMGYLNINGEEIFDDTYSSIKMFNDFGYSSVRYEGKYGLINETGEVVLDFIYDRHINFNDNMDVAEYYLNGKIGFIDSNLNIIVEPIYGDYNDINGFNNSINTLYNYGIYLRDDKYVIINNQGQEVFESNLEIQSVNDSYIKLYNEETDEFSLVDFDNNILVEPTTSEITINGTYDSYYFVEGADDWTNLVYNSDNELIFSDPVYCFISYQNNTSYYGFTTLDKSQTMVYDTNYNLLFILECDDPRIVQFSDGYFMFRNEGNCGICDIQGNILLDPNYGYINGNYIYTYE
ncbi:WG repeat-containing protein [Candidatus Izemoplasma sp. B36]|uniref:WG repeat-containing protein n=1 Tax=Candidatus Izemoplasma sp. B36 TaxID=3242468 RepID=UPI003556A633